MLREDPLVHIENDPLLVCLGDKDLTLEDVQCGLNNCNLTSLIVNIIMKSPQYQVMTEAVQLAVTLLDGGNVYVQVITKH